MRVVSGSQDEKGDQRDIDLDFYRVLADPEEVLVATAAYRSESDVVGEFLTTRARTGPSLEVMAKALYEDFKEWHADPAFLELTALAGKTPWLER